MKWLSSAHRHAARTAPRARPGTAVSDPPRAPELRRDPFSGRLVVVAPARASRPRTFRGDDFAAPDDDPAECPFCEGHEARTPPETFALGPPDRIPDTPGWRVRIVPNLYPAFERHEVVIHTPRHVHSLADLDAAELRGVAEAWSERAERIRSGGAAYVQAVVNEGRAAGASLAHTHSQLVGLAERPPAVTGEDAWTKDPCPLCAFLPEEIRDRRRVVTVTDELAVLASFAGRLPYELLVAPLRHETGSAFESRLLAPALELVADAFRRLFALEGRAPLNAWIHDGHHWHVEVVPRLSVLAGLELGAGIYVNTLAPEEAASRLRGVTV